MYEKYIEALRLMDIVIALKTAPVPEGGWPTAEFTSAHYGKQLFAVHPMHAAWDDCFNYMHDHFEHPKTGTTKEPMNVFDRVKLESISEETIKFELDKCRPLIDGTYPARGPEMDALMRSIPPQLLDIVWAVGVARFLLRDHCLPINHRLLTTFRRFHQMYGYMILAC